MKHAFLLLIFMPFAAQATPGGLDSKGCHHSKTQGYHCHNARAQQTGGRPSYSFSVPQPKKKKAHR
ncbi:MAG: YHYH domain-containing protein [Proteobacteria bacterium]|nr:YHYH domain-containing protein [Pseudomonadota bacterium]